MEAAKKCLTLVFVLFVSLSWAEESGIHVVFHLQTDDSENIYAVVLNKDATWDIGFLIDGEFYVYQEGIGVTFDSSAGSLEVTHQDGSLEMFDVVGMHRSFDCFPYCPGCGGFEGQDDEIDR